MRCGFAKQSLYDPKVNILAPALFAASSPKPSRKLTFPKLQHDGMISSSMLRVMFQRTEDAAKRYCTPYQINEPIPGPGKIEDKAQDIA